MKKIALLLLLLFGMNLYLNAQVGINKDGSSPDASAMLDIKATDAGILIPRMSMPQRDAIVSPATGLMVFVIDDASFYYFDRTNWTGLSGTKKIDDLSDGKSDSDGTDDGSSVFLGVDAGLNDDRNVGIGYKALNKNTTGNFNTAIGASAFNNATSTNYSNSTALGYGAEPSGSNRIHIENTAVNWIGGMIYWDVYSDSRIKTNVQEDVKGLDFILKLRPVTYHLDKDAADRIMGATDKSDYPGKYDIEKIKQSGFLAQEVETAAQEAHYDFSGVNKPKGDTKLYSLSYSEFVVPIIKAVQEQNEQIQQLTDENVKLKELNEQLQARLKK